MNKINKKTVIKVQSNLQRLLTFLDKRSFLVFILLDGPLFTGLLYLYPVFQHHRFLLYKKMAGGSKFKRSTVLKGKLRVDRMPNSNFPFFPVRLLSHEEQTNRHRQTNKQVQTITLPRQCSLIKTNMHVGTMCTHYLIINIVHLFPWLSTIKK